MPNSETVQYIQYILEERFTDSKFSAQIMEFESSTVLSRNYTNMTAKEIIKNVYTLTWNYTQILILINNSVVKVQTVLFSCSI